MIIRPDYFITFEIFSLSFLFKSLRTKLFSLKLNTSRNHSFTVFFRLHLMTTFTKSNNSISFFNHLSIFFINWNPKNIIILHQILTFRMLMKNLKILAKMVIFVINPIDVFCFIFEYFYQLVFVVSHQKL